MDFYITLSNISDKYFSENQVIMIFNHYANNTSNFLPMFLRIFELYKNEKSPFVLANFNLIKIDILPPIEKNYLLYFFL